MSWVFLGLLAGAVVVLIAAEWPRLSAHLGIEQRLCIGNGILAAETEEEALRLADIARSDAGGEAARACLALMQWRARLGS